MRSPGTSDSITREPDASERAILPRVRTRRRTIGRTLAVAVALLLGPLLVAQAVAAWRLVSLRDADLLASTGAAAQGLAAAADAALGEIVALEEATAASLATELPAVEKAALLEAARRPVPALRALAWFAPGRLPLVSPPDTPLAGWPTRSPAGRFAVAPGVRRGDAGPTFWLAVPVRGQRGRDAGTLVGLVVVGAFAPRLHHPLPEGGQPIILDAAGQVAFSGASPDLPAEARDWSRVAAVGAARRGQPGMAADARLPGVPHRVVVAFAPVGTTGWVAGVARPRAAALAAARRGIPAIFITSAAALALGLVGAALVARRLTRPLEHLAVTARSLAAGEAAQPVPAGLADEYAQIARAVAQAAREGRRRTGELDLTRRQLAAVLGGIPDPVVLSDAEGRPLATNGAADALLGATGESGWTPYPIFDAAGRALGGDALPAAQAAGSGKRATAVLQVGATGRERRLFAADAIPVADDASRPLGVVTIYRDVTERREAERRAAELAGEVRARTELIEALFSRLPAALALLQGADLRLRAANARLFQLAGIPEGPLNGRRLTDLFPAPVAAQIGGWIARAREAGTPERGIDIRIEGAKREAYWSYAVAPLRDTAASRDALLLVVDDTSDDVATRVKAQRAAEQVERKGAELDAVLRSLTDGVVLLDEGGRVAAMNRAAEQVLGRAAERGVTPTLEDFPRLSKLYEPAGAAMPPAQWPSTRALAGEATDRLEAFILTEALEKRFLALSAVPLRSRRGRVIGAAATFRDITREKEVESFKGQFIARAAHELRTPLTTIKGNLLLTLKGRFGALTGGQRKAVETATRSVDTMVSLIDDLLDITRIESGRLRLFGQEVSLGAILDRARAGTATLAATKDITLTVHPGMADIVGYWDAAKVEQVFANILSNAVKFTAAGGRVEVRAYLEALLVTVAVRDTGVGISREKLALIFQPFVTLHRHDPGAPRQRGTGLGLSIAQSIVEAHGGRMWAESEGTGRGTAIYLTLPLDHRRAERVRLDLPARVRSGETPIEPSVVVDLSTEGASILAPTPVLLAKEVTVELDTPVGEHVTATGEVVRVEPMDGEERYKAGVRFHGLPEAVRAAIIDWVRRERARRAAS